MASLAAASNMEVMVQQQPQPSSLSLMSDTEDAAMLEESSELDDPETLDLSSHGLTKLSRAAPGYDLTTLTLLLDNNSLQRLDNIHTYQCLEKVSKSKFIFLNFFSLRLLFSLFCSETDIHIE